MSDSAIPDSYRRDLDGLRALAILSVLLYHAGFGGMVPGGYVGVDVFFVISGFLITGIITREIDAGSFTLTRFYERRARRILPALLAMLFFVLIAAAFLYLPGDFEEVPRSALATLGFVSNFWFFGKIGYFAGGAETMPLLHTWSLAVEEQFYIIMPVALMMVAKWTPRWRNEALALGAAVSLLMAVLMQEWGGVDFYLLPPRAWEMLAGALLASGAITPVVRPALREAVSIAGLAAICIAMFVYDRSTSFPGFTALPPVLGTAALIHCGPGTRIGRLFSAKPLVGIGLISYSLYLWHWPLIVLAEYAIGARLSGWISAVVVVFSFVAAWLSWRFIEQPFRSPATFGQKAIFRCSAVGMLAIALIAGLMAAQGGWDRRFQPAAAQMMAGKADISPARSDCINDKPEAPRPACNLGAKGIAPDMLLWGDSHGVELAWALGQSQRDKGRAVMQRTRPSCPPVIGYDPASDPGCAIFNRAVLARLDANPQIRTVILAGFWASSAYAAPERARQLQETIAMLQNRRKQVVLIGPIPHQPFDVPRHLARLAAQGRDTASVRAPRDVAQGSETGWITHILPRLQQSGVIYLDPAAVLCDAASCAIVKDGQPLYFDSHHLSIAGARAILDPRSAR